MSPDEISAFMHARKLNELLERYGAILEELRERKKLSVALMGLQAITQNCCFHEPFRGLWKAMQLPGMTLQMKRDSAIKLKVAASPDTMDHDNLVSFVVCQIRHAIS
jgi:hypothetical protein